MRAWLFVVGFAGCAGGSSAPVGGRIDTDGDGLSDGKEAEYGTDPSLADTDGDGLSDWEDLRYGADPLVVDTDGDGYTDRDEVVERHDPADPADRIYTGGWPYNPNKDQLTDPGLDGTAALGTTFARLRWIDQFGEVVDLYDFAGHGKPVVVDLSAMWCGWCHELSYWLDHQPSADDFLFPPEYDGVREALANGELYWVTVLDGTATGSPPDLTTAELYHEMHPNPHVTLLVDHDREYAEYLFPTGLVYWPSLTLLDENLEPEVLPDLYVEEDALSVLAERFSD